jgi:two-component system OmpR family response regulator
MLKVMIIEDDIEMSNLISDYLAKHDIFANIFNEPINALKNLSTMEYDLIILDLGLPFMDGMDVLTELKDKPHPPIIISSARGAIDDKVQALELGAADYLPKPFDPRELVARIHAAVRKTNPLSSDIDNPFTLDEKARVIRKNNKNIYLTPAEYDIFSLLMKSPNTVFNRDQIVDNVDNMKWESVAKSVDVIIGRIRQKINDSTKPNRYIVTVKNAGYKYIP